MRRNWLELKSGWCIADFGCLHYYVMPGKRGWWGVAFTSKCFRSRESAMQACEDDAATKAAAILKSLEKGNDRCSTLAH